MRITHLKIGGFGAWSDLRVEGLDDGLNVLYGPNEAGKTTLLQFVRSMFYGFTGKRRGYLPPLHGGEGGGLIGVRDDTGRYDIQRVDRAGGDELTIHAADGMRHGEHMLKTLLSNIDEQTFSNIFAMGLREMQELGALSDADAASLLYGLTVGVDRASLVDVMRALEQSRCRILDAQGKPSQISQLFAEHAALQGELDELAAQSRRYGRIAAERHDLDDEIARLEDECRRAASQAQLAEAAINLRDRWLRRAAIDEELAAFGPSALMPAGAAERYDSLNAKIQGLARESDDVRLQQEELRLEIEGLEVNEALARQAARIEALAEQEPWLANLEGQAARLKEEIESLEAALAADRKQLGLEGPDDRLPDLSARVRSALKVPQKELSEAGRRLAESEQALAEAEAVSSQLESQFQAAMAAIGQTDLATAIEKAGGLVAQLRRCDQAEARVEQMAKYQEELEEQSQHLLAPRLLPMRVIGGLAGVFALGVVLFLSGIFAPGTILGSVGLTLAVVGIVSLGTAAGGKILLDRSNAKQLENIRGQLTMLTAQLAQSRDEAEALGAKLGLAGSPAGPRLAAAQKDLAALEEQVPLEGRRTAARQAAEAAARRREQSAEDLAAARKRWAGALRAAGLPKNLRPGRVRRIFARRDQLAQQHRTLDKLREELAQRTGERKALCMRIDQLVSDAGLKLSGAPAEKLQALVAALARQEAALAERGTLRTKIKRLRRRQSVIQEKSGRLKRRRKGLLLECGAEDEEAFRRRAADAARLDALRKERTAVDREIESAVAGRFSFESLRTLIEGAGAGQLHQRRDDLCHRAATLDGELKQRIEKRGQLAEQLAAFAGDRRMALKRFEIAAVETRVERAIRRWQVQAIACRALDDIRTTYEHQRQPETLQEASRHFERMTEGRYRRVWTPLDESVLKVEDGAGHSRLVEHLSRGTREQLFLSLRLALAAWHARHGAAAPLILDDVLVNFDAARMRAAAETLGAYAAEGRQLLVLTCHEHMLEVFARLGVPIARLPSNADPSPPPVRFQRREDDGVPAGSDGTTKPGRPDAAKSKSRRRRATAAEPVADLPEEPDRDADIAAETDEETLVPVRSSRRREKKARKKKTAEQSDRPKGVFDVDYFENDPEEEAEESPPFDFEFEEPEEEEAEETEEETLFAEESEESDDAFEGEAEWPDEAE